MGYTNGSSTDPERRASCLAKPYQTSMNATASTHLPYVLAEAMVNHKKMVHPPC